MSKPEPNITIRPARFSDLHPSSLIMSKAFHTDDLFGRVIHPHRHQYPDDMGLFFYRMWLREWFDWAMVFLVAVQWDEGRGVEEIVGVAQWHRIGESAGRCGWGVGRGDIRNLLPLLSNPIAKIHEYLYPNRALDPTKARVLFEGEAYTSYLWSTPPRSDRWYLHFLGVHPAHQGKGIGRKLVHWGFEQAATDGVGASVISAPGKDGFYYSCGFEEVIGWAGEGRGNPFGIVEGGNIWWVGAEKLRERARIRGDGGSGVEEVKRGGN